MKNTNSYKFHYEKDNCSHQYDIGWKLRPYSRNSGHYANLLNDASVILYGRITYQLMQFWQPLLKNPTGEKSMDDFAMAIDKVPKFVISNSLKDTEWDSDCIAVHLPSKNTG